MKHSIEVMKKKISEKKLTAEIDIKLLTDREELDWEGTAYQIALDLVEGNKVDMDDVMEVRYESTMYTDVLKGDYIIKMYINSIKIQKELEEARKELGVIREKLGSIEDKVSSCKYLDDSKACPYDRSNKGMTYKLNSLDLSKVKALFKSNSNVTTRLIENELKWSFGKAKRYLEAVVNESKTEGNE